jgi:cystathionine gamma-synthase
VAANLPYQRGVKPETLAARGAHPIDPQTGALVPPIHTSTTFARDEAYRLLGGALYARDEAPSFGPAEDLLAQLEGGADALLFASGMAAASAAVGALTAPGAHLVASRVVYWGLRAWLERFARQWQVEVTWTDTTDAAALAAALRPGVTRLVWIETPANPTWEVTDIERAAELAHGAGALLVVDSTVATPVFCRPIALGADLVMHSATKYLNGHGDVVAGALVTARQDEAWAAIRAQRHDGGAILGPFEAWLLARGLRTLYPRVRAQAASALALASRLAGHPGVTRVRYPGLPGDPGHPVARRQMDGGFGAMLSIQVGSRARALAVAGRLGLFVRATSLGGTESLVEHRASVEPPTSPVPDDLLRLSIGLEDPEDLWADLEGALAG